MVWECFMSAKILKIYLKRICGCQLISFAVNRFGYLVLPKAFQKNASHPFGFFNTRKLRRAYSLRSLWSKCCLSFEASFNQIPHSPHPLCGMLSTPLRIKKACHFRDRLCIEVPSGCSITLYIIINQCFISIFIF